MEVVSYDELHLYCGDSSTVFLLDEYYEALKESSMSYNPETLINPIFKMGKFFKAIGFAAHESQKFESNLKQMYGNGNVSFLKFKSIPGLVGAEQVYNPNVICTQENFSERVNEIIR